MPSNSTSSGPTIAPRCPVPTAGRNSGINNNSATIPEGGPSAMGTRTKGRISYMTRISLYSIPAGALPTRKSGTKFGINCAQDTAGRTPHTSHATDWTSLVDSSGTNTGPEPWTSYPAYKAGIPWLIQGAWLKLSAQSSPTCFLIGPIPSPASGGSSGRHLLPRRRSHPVTFCLPICMTQDSITTISRLPQPHRSSPTSIIIPPISIPSTDWANL